MSGTFLVTSVLLIPSGTSCCADALRKSRNGCQSLSSEEARIFCSLPTPPVHLVVLLSAALPVKPLAGSACVHLTQAGLDQAEGLFDEVVELVDRSQGVDADNGEELFEARGKAGWGHVQLVDQILSILAFSRQVFARLQAYQQQASEKCMSRENEPN